ncbi:MAG: helix-turn-helix domain-containing protein [Chryseolinea sp.]
MQLIIVYSLTAGGLLLLLLATLSTPRKVNLNANYWLSLFLFSFCCAVFDRVLFDAEAYVKYPLLEGLIEVTRFAMAPALYFSVLFFTTPHRKFKTKDAIHFVPFFLFLIYILVLVFDLHGSTLFYWYVDLPDAIHRGVAISVFSSIKVQMITYWILSYVQLHRHTRNIPTFASTLEPISLSWMRYFLLGLAVAVFLSLNEVLAFVPAIIPITHFGYLALVLYLGYFSLRQQEIYPYQTQDIVQIHDILQTGNQGVRTQRFSGEELSKAKERLLLVMETEKAHLDPHLGLPQLAVQTGLSTHDLSFVINEGFGENFFQFINRYRVVEAKRLLLSSKHKHLSILGIAFDSGFRSKSTFNTTFRRFTGLSPSEFMRSPENIDNEVNEDNEENDKRRSVG